MKKIPTLFVREFISKREFILKEEVTPGMEWVLNNEGVATVKIDGSCTAIIDGKFYKRYDAKQGKKVPDGAIPCSNPDPVSGHYPHWVLVNLLDNGSKWYYEAYINTDKNLLFEGTYEAIGPHFQGNPYHLEKDILVRHGIEVVEVERTFQGIKDYLETHYIEGLVFWKDNQPQCKIKRRDFLFSWNTSNQNDKVKPLK